MNAWLLGRIVSFHHHDVIVSVVSFLFSAYVAKLKAICG